MFKSEAVLKLQEATVARWHIEPVDNLYDGFLGIVCKQHAFNYNLWHQEDIARSRDVTDSEIAQVKRNIDTLNQNRNDWIEKIDDWISEMLSQQGELEKCTAPMNTETPGSVIDRLSIIALRIYHLQEQLERNDVGQEHLDSVQQKIAICLLQRSELAQSLDELICDLLAGRKRHRTYRQFKMYNDPALNPYLYQQKTVA